MKTRMCIALSVLGFLLGGGLSGRAVYKGAKKSKWAKLGH
jgi:hypothetical protein